MQRTAQNVELCTRNTTGDTTLEKLKRGDNLTLELTTQKRSLLIGYFQE